MVFLATEVRHRTDWSSIFLWTQSLVQSFLWLVHPPPSIPIRSWDNWLQIPKTEAAKIFRSLSEPNQMTQRARTGKHTCIFILSVADLGLWHRVVVSNGVGLSSDCRIRDTLSSGSWFCTSRLQWNWAHLGLVAACLRLGAFLNWWKDGRTAAESSFSWGPSVGGPHLCEWALVLGLQSGSSFLHQPFRMVAAAEPWGTNPGCGVGVGQRAFLLPELSM